MAAEIYARNTAPFTQISIIAITLWPKIGTMTVRALIKRQLRTVRLFWFRLHTMPIHSFKAVARFSFCVTLIRIRITIAIVANAIMFLPTRILGARP
jgi:hypothetical protein